MVDYKTSIKNLDDYSTTADVKYPNEDNMVTEIVEVKGEILSTTSTSEPDSLGLIGEKIAPYMSPKKIIMKKYRFKK